MCFYLLKRKSRLEPATTARDIFYTTAIPATQFFRTQFRSQMTRITEDKDAREQNTASGHSPLKLEGGDYGVATKPWPVPLASV